MNVEVELPDMGDDAGDEATIAEWYIDEGAHVEEGEVLVEVERDGNSFDVVSTATGTLLEQLYSEEEIVRVGDVLAIIECAEGDYPDEEEEEQE